MGTTFFDVFGERLVAAKAALQPVRFVSLIHLAWQVRRERNKLAGLSRCELADMGIHPGDAELEAQRRRFDLPKSRLDEL